MSSLTVLGATAATVLAAASAIGTLALVPAAHQARSAADAGALAAADQLLWAGGDPCEWAASVVEAGGAQLVSCRCDPADCWVNVRVWSGPIALDASARAGAD